jgi:hypothetical protein
MGRRTTDPKAGYSKNKKRNVSIPETLYARLKKCLPIPKTAVFIEQILLDFVSNATPEQQTRIAVALSALPRAAFRARTRRKEKTPKVEKPEKIKEPADVRFQLEKFEKQKRAENPRPTYAERREQQKRDFRSDSSSSRGVVIQMTATCFGRNTKFKDEAAAREAAAQYSKDKGYPVMVVWCESCKAFHVTSGSEQADKLAEPTVTGGGKKRP